MENRPVLKNTYYREVKYVFVVSEAMNKTEEESENLHRQLLDREIDLGAFVQKYKKLRTTYHKRALIHLAAKTSSTGWMDINTLLYTWILKNTALVHCYNSVFIASSFCILFCQFLSYQAINVVNSNFIICLNNCCFQTITPHLSIGWVLTVWMLI